MTLNEIINEIIIIIESELNKLELYRDQLRKSWTGTVHEVKEFSIIYGRIYATRSILLRLKQIK